MTAGEDSKPKSDLDRALEDLLVGEVRVKVDRATGQIVGGQIVEGQDGEKTSLTDSEDAPTIP
jgi:hypothetical protein